MALFREGQAALEQHTPTKTKLALSILHRIISDIEAERREWEFSALSPQEQAKERERMEKANREWKERIAEIKRRHGVWNPYQRRETTAVISSITNSGYGADVYEKDGELYVSVPAAADMW